MLSKKCLFRCSFMKKISIFYDRQPNKLAEINSKTCKNLFCISLKLLLIRILRNLQISLYIFLKWDQLRLTEAQLGMHINIHCSLRSLGKHWEGRLGQQNSRCHRNYCHSHFYGYSSSPSNSKILQNRKVLPSDGNLLY